MTKKLFIILILIIIPNTPIFAQTQKGCVEFEGIPYNYELKDKPLYLQKADKNMVLFEKSTSQKEKKIYLKEAMKYYFFTSKIDPGSIDAHIGLARIYDELNIDRYAKKHFSLAYNINHTNPKMSMYFGDFYYKRHDLVTAMSYYNTALNNGYSNNYTLHYKLGRLNEKLADIEMAKKHYNMAYKLNAASVELANKINTLKDLNYSETQYYLFNKNTNK